MLFFITIAGLLFIHYAWLLIGMTRSIKCDQIEKQKNNLTQHSLSVIIPFRNEANRLNKTIKSLSQLNYDKEKLEIILVNDHSEDHFVSVLDKMELPPSLRIIENNGNGKKEAIESGIVAAKNDWIVCSDADCLFHSEWLEKCNDALNSLPADLYLFPVYNSSGTGLLARFQFYDQLSTLGFNLGYYFFKGKSLLANGANLMFRKTDFQRIDPFKGNKEISSGDDMFLLQEFQKDGLTIKMNCNKELWVLTEGQKSWTSFFDQRIRWAKKMNHLSSAPSFYLGIYIFIIQLSLWTALFLGFYKSYMFYFFLILILIKGIVDTVLLKKTSSILNLKSKLVDVCFFEFIYMMYVPLIVVLSIFRTPNWKGRKLLNRI